MAVFPDQAIRGEVFRLLVVTKHRIKGNREALAVTAVHDQRFSRRIGGVRFVKDPPPSVQTEVAELAAAMTWKCALAGIPADGEKTEVYCSGELPEDAEKARLLAEHLAELAAADRGVILGPDIDCGVPIMEMLAREYGLGDHVAGLPQGNGGLSINERGYTATGLEAAVMTAAGHFGWTLVGMDAVIEGFGAVGAHIANRLSHLGVQIKAASSKHGVLVSMNEEGLPVDLLFRSWLGEGDKAFLKYRDNVPDGARFTIDRRDLWLQPADIVVPAARADVLASEAEIHSGLLESFDVVDFLRSSGVRMLVEGANHPLTDAAEALLEEAGVLVLPDYLINCGGLVGCWADWVYREELLGAGGAKLEERLNRDLPAYVRNVVAANTAKVLAARRDGGSMRTASIEFARAAREQVFADFSRGLSGRTDVRQVAREMLQALVVT